MNSSTTHRTDLTGAVIVIEDEPIDLVDVRAADLPEHRRGRDREPAIEQESDHLPLGMEPRHLPLKEQPVEGLDLERHVIGE